MADDDRRSRSSRIFAHTIRRRGVIAVGLLALIGLILGGSVGMKRAEQRTAEATVLVTPLEGNPFTPDGKGNDLINLETEAQLLQSDTVAHMVINKEGLDEDPSAALSMLTVVIPPNTQILKVQYSSKDPDLAVRRAQDFSDSYLSYRKKRAQSLVDSRTTKINKQISAAESRLDDLDADLKSTKSASSKSNVNRKIDGVSSQLVQLRSRLSELQSGSDDPGQVVTPATIVSASPPKTIGMFAILGLLCGAGIGAVALTIRRRANRKVSAADDIEVTGLAVLGSVSRTDIDDFHGLTPGTAPVPRSYQQVRVSVLARDGGRPRCILVAPTSEYFSGPSTATGLARATARSRIPTVLIDASARANGPTEEFDLTSAQGLAEVLAGQAELDSAVVEVAPHLNVLPQGQDAVDANELFVAPQMSATLEKLTQYGELLIISGASLHEPQTRAIANLADCIIAEVEQRHTTQRSIADTVEHYASPAPLLGAIFVEGPRSSRGRHILKPKI